MNKQEVILSHFRVGKSQWQIHRDTGISRKTIRKYVREYEEKKRELLNSKEDVSELIVDIVSSPKYDSSNRVRRKLKDEIIVRIGF